MKRLAQCVALLVLALLIAQPALASLACAPAVAMCAPGCPMQMSDMGADCPMTMQAAASGCPQGCCAASGPQSAALIAAIEKQKLDTAFSAVFFAHVDATSTTPFVPSADFDAPPGSPPLYLLHRAFRN